MARWKLGTHSVSVEIWGNVGDINGSSPKFQNNLSFAVCYEWQILVAIDFDLAAVNSWIQNAASKFMNIESWVRLHFCWVNNMLSQKSKNCNHLDMFHMILLRISVSDHKPRVEPKRCNFWASKPIFPCPFMFCCCGFHFISSKVIFYLTSVSIYCIDTCNYI